MNKTIGFSTLLTGLFFLACGALHIANNGYRYMDQDTGLFLGGGIIATLAGIALWGGVHIGAPGSLMTRRDEQTPVPPR